MNKTTEAAIIEARKLMKLTAPRRDIRIPFLKILMTTALLLATWKYLDHVNERIEFLEAATADLNIKIHQFGLDGGIR